MNRNLYEGLAKLSTHEVSKNSVFYNPAQVVNRDLSLLVLKTFANTLSEEISALPDNVKEKLLKRECQKLLIVEPLAATGLRSIRYALELREHIKYIVAGDLDPAAVQCIEKSRIDHSIDSMLFTSVCSDANNLLHLSKIFGVKGSLNVLQMMDIKNSKYRSLTNQTENASCLIKETFNVIDLDPYGSVASFIDAAVVAIEDSGLLCLTSTDMPILCGNNPEVSFYKYGGTALKAPYMHEMSLRLLINAIAEAAARHQRIVEPILCCSIDFYIRCFVRIRTSPFQCKYNASKSSLVYQCASCPAFTINSMGTFAQAKNNIKFKVPQLQGVTSVCDQCDGTKIYVGGPFYSGPLYNKDFIQRCIKNINDPTILPTLTMRPKILGILTAISEEIEQPPLHYDLPYLMSSIKTELMKLSDFKSTIRHLGYNVSHFHRCPQSIKTNAPNTVIFDIIRQWALDYPPKKKDHSFLKKKITTEDVKLKLSSSSTEPIRVPRWLPNPESHWGPKKRAKIMVTECSN
ncbi:tRNA (guanine(26)-N(2))-dimethyltransferase-like isoform X1 [Hylaeus volcanicus]|uniref:tRNA (guanine(26)-N(2))-dimethyltransferase-like isoform X1 n=1 Tax=Hylaeus volcanicus TaxID=313075 RepID=UPI0023B7A96A|nr:tRNA (guanine(26)-N(2))-dimethyltransferase-like isoform X1 [Hylaeus volcanicus]XP_053990665.1 tRNA (guanine(26)-N(2))-dimethyltransferase-like isoform X1 [Hylaeus volcanicus]XP_053990666.1 tRNA (guanine(26)-N(2))-dimethyltransferase-like isoform X1 [Hylaeus volcanicus]